MKNFSEEILIHRPIAEVVHLFTALEHYPEWQPDLYEYNTFEGTPGEEGAKSRLVYREGKNDTVKLVETILEKNLPGSYKVKYNTDGVISYFDHSFEKVEDNKTLYRLETEYDLQGLMKIMGVLNPGHFKAQHKKFMENFKEFVENFNRDSPEQQS